MSVIWRGEARSGGKRRLAASVAAALISLATLALCARADPPAPEEAWTPQERKTLITPWSIGFASMSGPPIRGLRLLYPEAAFRCHRYPHRAGSLLTGSWVVADDHGELLFAMSSDCKPAADNTAAPHGLTGHREDVVDPAFLTTSPRFATPEGVRVGDTLAKAAKVYGMPLVTRETQTMIDSRGEEIYSTKLGGHVQVFWEAVFFPFAVPAKHKLRDPRHADYGNYLFIAEPSSSRDSVGRWPTDKYVYKDVTADVDMSARIIAIAPGHSYVGYGEGKLCVSRLRDAFQKRLLEHRSRRSRLPRYADECGHVG